MSINYPSEQTNETYLSIKNSEPQILKHEIVENTNKTDNKHILLTIGPNELEQSDVLFEINGPRKMHSQLITSDNEFAIRAYLQELEEHNVDEEYALNSIHEIEDKTNINPRNLNKNQSKKDRAKHIVNTAKYLFDRYESKRQIFYIKEGTWRKTNPNKDIVKKADSILDSSDRNTQACYKTAFLAALALRSNTDIENNRISYCEGIALCKYGGIPNQHAWIEIDNQVIELTWPWSGPKPVKNSLYYGLEPEWDTVYERMTSRPTYASVFMSDNEYYSRSTVINAIKNKS